MNEIFECGSMINEPTWAIHEKQKKSPKKVLSTKFAAQGFSKLFSYAKNDPFLKEAFQ